MDLIRTIAYRDYPVEMGGDGDDLNFAQRDAFIFGVTNVLQFLESWGYKKGVNMLQAEYFEDHGDDY